MFGHTTYLALELAWAAPVLAIQWLAGAGALWRRRAALGAAVLAATAYLSAADAFAISDGIWTLSPARTLAFRIGPLPLEEALFFLLTNLMIVQTLVLLASPEPIARVKRFFGRAA